MPDDPKGGPFARIIIAIAGYGGRAILAIKNLFSKDKPEQKGS
jgi:hypothetical protein